MAKQIGRTTVHNQGAIHGWSAYVRSGWGSPDWVWCVGKLSERLPKSAAGSYYANQILRSSNAPAPMYAEARCAESPADFIHKMKIALKELNETRIWLRVIDRYEFFKAGELAALQDENGQLIRIFSASIVTARKNSGKGSDSGSRKSL